MEKGLPDRLRRFGILAPAIEQTEAKEDAKGKSTKETRAKVRAAKEKSAN